METGDDEDDDLPLSDLNDNQRYANMEPYKVRKLSDSEQTLSPRPRTRTPQQRVCDVLGRASEIISRTSYSSDIRTSQLSDNHPYSPEDTLNNDFFYDDEFAVQFDATLGVADDDEGGGLQDSMELVLRSGVTSQSRSGDSCLCASGASDSNAMDVLTSSDLSDFKPLFSPTPPHGTDLDLRGDLGDSSDSLCNEELAGSLVKEEDRYAFDWTQTKDKYMISFDRSPTKYSSEDSYSEPPPPKRAVMMSWGRNNNGSSSGGSGPVCSSTTSANSGTSSGQRSSSVGNGNDSDTSTSSTMTTWKLVHRQGSETSPRDTAPEEGAVPEGMLTWRTVSEMDRSQTKRSQSMPDLQPPEPELPREDEPPKRYSASLLEMYRRLKSCPAMDYAEYSEGGAEYAAEYPGDAEFPAPAIDIDNWSVSPASSHQLSPSDGSYKALKDGALVKWNTVKNLIGEEKQKDRGVPGSVGVQAGSILADTTGHKQAQFPPTLAECGIQTSFENRAKSTTSTALQTSWELLARSPWLLRRSLVQRRPAIRRPHSAGPVPHRRSAPADDRFTVKLSQQAKVRMTQSLFFNSTALPDLSFLDKIKPVSLLPTPPPAPPRRSESKTKVEYRPKKPPRSQQRPRSACLSETFLLGARHRSRSSDSASSFCSSSSSGIDPGSYDSLSGRTYLPTRRDDYHRPSDAKIIVARDTPQPQKAEIYWQSPQQAASNAAKACHICKAQSQLSPGEREAMAASHPGCNRGDEGCDCQQGACMPAPVCVGYVCSVTSACRECFTQSKGSITKGVKMRRPLKSCLAKKGRVDRKLRTFKHRSWSDPSDGLVMKYSQEGQIKYQLVTREECVRRPGAAQREDSGPRADTSRPPLAEIDLLQDLPPSEQKRASQDDTPPQPPPPRQQSLGARQPAPPTPRKSLPPNRPPPPPPIQSPVKNIDGVVLRRKRPMTTPPNSPEQIPVPACTCGTTHAVLHSSSDSSGDGANHTCCDIYRSKKSVSFSEEISYHSPYPSPHASPRRRVRPLVSTHADGVVRHPINRSLATPRRPRPVSLPPDFRLLVPQLGGPAIPESPGCESPPQEFVVSPLSSITLTPSPTDAPDTDLALKKVLVHDVMKATEKLLYYFGQTRDPDEKTSLGSSGEFSEVGHLVLEYLCPAVYAIVHDGLKLHVRSLFGKVKNSVWKVVEESQNTGPASPVIRSLVTDLKSLDFLTTSWLRFNAFIFGLLNHKALDLWLSQLSANDKLLARHYTTDSFLRRTVTEAKPVFLDLITVIQPLAQMPLRLEYNFEYRLLEGRQHQQLSDTILDKHVSAGAEGGSLERRQWQIQQTQAQRLQELSVLASSASPVRGEVSPIVGQRGVAGDDALHHSAPEVYTPQQVVMWSPTKARWHSLYDKVSTQLSGSQLARRSREVVADTSRHLLASLRDSKKLHLSRGALQHLGQDLVTAAVGVSGRVSALPRVPGLTDSGASDTTLGGPSPPPGARRKALMVFGDQEMVVSAQTSSSDEDRDSEGILKRVSGLFSSPRKAYKRGVTEYQFHVCRDKAAKVTESRIVAFPRPPLARAKSLDESWRQRESLFDHDGLPRSCSLDQAPVEFHIPSRSDSGESGPSKPDARPRDDKPDTDSQRTLTDSQDSHKSAPSPTRPSHYLTKKLGSSLRKSWSSFGPSLVSWMDKLLLEDPSAAQQKARSEESLPIRTEEVVTATEEVVTVKEAVVTTTEGVSRLRVDGSGQQEDTVTSLTATDNTNTEPQPQQTEDAGQEERNWFVQALCHHVAMQDDQLSFNKGTVLAVVKETTEDWLLCRHGDKEGLVHKACVTKA